MNIRIIQSRVTGLNVHRKEFIDDENNLELNYSASDIPESPNNYSISFNVKLQHKMGFSYEVEYESIFETDNAIDEEFMNSHFVSVNSPAIAYPFLRAYMANLMLSSGHDPIMLPTINFTRFKNNK
ncbi:TPA: protein-export chaperone SecB [Vibrio vulnificus]|uniref:protein-export chaperone SecB n=1 Tax=Vibrio sp. HENC-03 TaxID=992012 RepID=UPI0006AD0803|nr:protein-export chaperone SecB [Vibrio sp. HENC-03]HDY7864582.1 protein-export chaperone SecB [Vibrio vulnificus]HDY7878450.1 protein-export chaperone SecB [Vibrio vulnificus]